MIETAETRFQKPGHVYHRPDNAIGGVEIIPIPPDRFAEWAVRMHGKNRQFVRHLPSDVHGSESVAAFVNDGRWLVQCPSCNGAQWASDADHRFKCDECLNSWCGGVWVRVVWPAQRRQIEALLEARPLRAQNWTPDQSLDELAAANAAHGVAS